MSARPIGLDPAGGDVVSCWFPHDDAPLDRGAKLRPALVVTYESDIDGPFVRVAYPTGQRTDDKNGASLPPHCFTVDPQGRLRLQTTFDFSKVVRLPFTDKWFEPWKGEPSILLCKLSSGQLPEARLARQAGDEFTARRHARMQAAATAAPVTVTIKKPARQAVQLDQRGPAPDRPIE